VEIWEIALYNDKVRIKLHEAYMSWIEEMGTMLVYYIKDKDYARHVCIAMVAFWEGMALFSTVFPLGALNIEAVLKGFQERIIGIL